MGGPKNRGYKRSWKNLLLNKRYQLRFTLFMVIMSGLLMGGLGWWVMSAATESTTIGVDAIRGSRECVSPPKPYQGMQPVTPGINIDSNELDHTKQQTQPGSETTETIKPTQPSTNPGDSKTVSNKVVDGAKTGSKQQAVAGDDDDDDGDIANDQEYRKWKDSQISGQVQIVLDVKIDPKFAEKTIEFYTCQLDQVRAIGEVRASQDQILWVLVAVGLLLMVGLTGYGLKMTHRVAGPLHKVSLYFAKMRDETYDTVWNLRKGDQLVEFYQHFKAAHQGLKNMQQTDIEQLKGMIDVAEKEDLAAKSPEIAAAIAELREILDRKEASIDQ